jgi:hypothetical protein
MVMVDIQMTQESYKQRTVVEDDREMTVVEGNRQITVSGNRGMNR